MKVGIIRCQQTEDLCAAITCLKVAAKGELAFEKLGPCEVTGIVSCGGCPGKRAVLRAKSMKEKGAKAIVLASCITKGNPIGFPCPHVEKMKEAIRRQIGEDTLLLEYSH